MRLDSATLGAAFVLLSGVLGLLLLFSFALNRRVRALAWWGAAYCVIPFGLGLVSLGQGAPGYWVLLVSNCLVLLSYGLICAGCRVFNGSAGALPTSVLGTVVWIAAFPFIHDWHPARLVVASVIAGTYAFLSAWELARHARHRLVSQKVAVALLAILTGFNILRGLLGLFLFGFATTMVPWVDVFALRWSSTMGLLLLLFVPALAFVFLSMAKEFVEFDHKQAALVDPLTGIPNRRAFLQNATALIARLGDRPASCLLFDLDNFKRINDGYGHETGDHILALFGETLAAHLPKASFGRMGGEEFSAIVALSSDEALALAEEIRRAFAKAAGTVLGRRVDATVSIGCATASRASVSDLLREADMALYQVKATGRNAVATAPRGRGIERRRVPRAS